MKSINLKGFLSKYDTIIFDMDGVITSESSYWDAAALTVYQQIEAKELFCDLVDIEYYYSHVKEIRKKVFINDELINVLKNKGVNSNWDLAYVTLGILKIVGETEFEMCLKYAKNLNEDIFEIYDNIARELENRLNIDDASRDSLFWEKLMMRFQEWVLGDVLFEKIYGIEPSQKGKIGLLANEEPVVDKERLKGIIKSLKLNGKRLCTATGRIWEELESPLKKFEIIDYFAEDGFINFNNVISVQEQYGIQVTKPHPYMFQKALYGSDFPDENILNGNFNKDLIKKTLVVGDAGADILGAKAMGADFCAVLTGVKGKAAKAFFEQNEAEYILDSILDFEE